MTLHPLPAYGNKAVIGLYRCTHTTCGEGQRHAVCYSFLLDSVINQSLLGQ